MILCIVSGLLGQRHISQVSQLQKPVLYWSKKLCRLAKYSNIESNLTNQTFEVFGESVSDVFWVNRSHVPLWSIWNSVNMSTIKILKPNDFWDKCSYFFHNWQSEICGTRSHSTVCIQMRVTALPINCNYESCCFFAQNEKLAWILPGA